MAEFLTTHNIASEIEKIIRNSESGKRLVLMSPYLQISKVFFDRLQDADNRGVRIHIIYRENKMSAPDNNKLYSLRNIRLSCCDNLHAKCYCNEDAMVITSMNFYEFSEKNNREMGVLVNNKDDYSVFRAGWQEIESILAISKSGAIFAKPKSEFTKVNITKERYKPKQKEEVGLGSFLKKTAGAIGALLEEEKGYCIRCHTRIDLNTEHPLCKECWRTSHKPTKTEIYCHTCGKISKTMINKPQCPSCYKADN